MADERIDVTDHQTGQAVPVPADVMRVVTQADQIVETQLAPLRHLPLRTSWCHFENDPREGWLVAFHVFTSEHGYGRQVRVEDLRLPSEAKEFVWGVLSDFAQTYSTKIGEQIQQIRTDLKQLLAAGHE